MVDNDEVQIPDCLVLAKGGDIGRFVVIQQCGDQSLRIKVRLSHKNINQIRRLVCHQHTAIFVEHISFALPLQNFQSFQPFLALDPVG